MIDEKMAESVSSEELGSESRLKCLVNLGVRGDLPPPGGAAAEMSMVLSISFHRNDLRS